MFSTFLIGIVLASMLVLLVLLAAPRPKQDAQSRTPWLGLAMAVLVAALGFIGGLALGA